MKRSVYSLIFISAVFIFTSCGADKSEVLDRQDAGAPIGSPNFIYPTPAPDYPDDVIGRIDYPLIEYYFGSGNAEDDFVAILYENLFTADAKVKIITDGGTIGSIQSTFHLLTFAAGKGTTPEGIFYLYRNGELLKMIGFINFVDYDDSMFELSSLDELSEVYGIENLPTI